MTLRDSHVNTLIPGSDTVGCVGQCVGRLSDAAMPKGSPWFTWPTWTKCRKVKQ